MTAIVLEHVEEPVETKAALAVAPNDVRHAALRQATDVVTPIYRKWKNNLREAGISWQGFQAAASQCYAHWNGWVEGEVSWDGALQALVSAMKSGIDTLELAPDPAGHARHDTVASGR